MSVTLLTDAVVSEAYRFSRNRVTVFWSLLFVPVVGLVLSVVGQMFLKQRMTEITDTRLPPGMLQPGVLHFDASLIEVAGGLANPMLLLFILIGTATIYAGDYRWETWRLISARNTRPHLILGKVGVAKLLTLAALLVSLVLGLAGELAKAGIHGQTIDFGVDGSEAGRFGLLSLIGYVRVVQVGLLGLLAAVLTRSLLAALFVPLVVTVGQFFLMQALPLFGWDGTEWYALTLIPGLAYDTLKGAVVGGAQAALPASAPALAALSLALWCVLPLLATIAAFQRQDLSKE